jgi:nucleotide-binding universal stress UspA family protein
MSDAAKRSDAAQWVVGVDGSEDSARALRWAIAQAPEHHARITAVSTWNVPIVAPVGIAGTAVMGDWSEVEAAVRDRLEAIVGSVDHRGVEIDTMVVQGSAARSLIEISAEADLLVLGSRGLAGFKQLVLGSVSRQCVTHAPVPTVVVPLDAPIGAIRRAVVGVDGSESSCVALRWALGFVRHDAVVDVVGAFEISPYTDPETTRARFPAEVLDAEREFDQVVDRLDPERRTTRHFSLSGARRALHDAAHHADMVVLGPRGRGVIGSAILGSVSNWILHHADCAVVIVPDSPSHH